MGLHMQIEDFSGFVYMRIAPEVGSPHISTRPMSEVQGPYKDAGPRAVCEENVKFLEF